MNVAERVEWRRTDEGLRPFLRDNPNISIAWAPLPGSQEFFLDCPVTEALMEGNRGPGKSVTLIMDFGQHCGRGFGQQWRGALFRQTYPQLVDLIAKTLEWFPRIFPAATYNRAEHYWSWLDGEKLYLRQIKTVEDYWNYHGWSLPWIGWDELTTWTMPDAYKRMFSVLRSAHPGIPLKVRATTNPSGPGHNWVKQRFRLPVPPGRVAGDIIWPSPDPKPDDDVVVPRVAIHSHLRENKILLDANPDYVKQIRAAARNPQELAAWLDGSWDIVAGGMFDDLWDASVHVIPALPLDRLPRGWKLDRGYDHGQSKPFSVGWYAQSNGEVPRWLADMNLPSRPGSVRGDILRVQEWYGWNGQPNEGCRMLATEIADGIKAREREWFAAVGRRRGMNPVRPGPADASIFDAYEGTKSVAGDMASKGVRWQAADKGPGSRKQGWQQMRKMLKGALLPEGAVVRETPGLFVTDVCRHFIRTVPVLPRDTKGTRPDPDDVDTDAEDHVADEVRYRVRAKVREIRQEGYM